MKKLYRQLEGKKAAGICSGIAEMYGWDVTVVRLAFVFATVLTQVAPGIITYLVGWYLIPPKSDEDNISTL